MFQETYHELRPRVPMPEIGVEFFAFANINNTIRLRGGKLFVRISDLLEGAPEPLLRAIAHILLAKMCFFYGLLARPQMTWSRDHARNRLGHYDPAHNAIVVSRAFDHPRVPRNAVEYIVYHEMLHLKHPVKLNGIRRCVHSEEFQAEEKLFPHLEEAKRFLKHL